MTSVTSIDLPRAFVSTVVFGISTLAGTGTVTVIVGLREATTVVCDVDNNNAFGGLDVMALLTVADILSTVVCDVSTLVAGTDTVTVVVGLREAATVVCDVEDTVTVVVGLREAATVVCDVVDLRRANRLGNTDGIDVENDFDDGNSNCGLACVFIIKMITPFVCTVSCMTGTMLCAGSCVTGTVLPIVGLQIIGFETTGTLTVGVQTILCVVGLCTGSCVTGAMLCVDSCVPGTVKNGVLYATRFVNDFLSDDIVAVAPFVVKLPRCNFSPLGSSIVSISASCF